MSKDINTCEDNSETVRVSDILETSGKYQILQYLYLCLPAVFVSMINVNYIFVAGEVNYRCRIPECETNFTYTAPWWPNSHFDECSKPILNTTDYGCTNDSFTSATEECTDWIYENSDTIISELDLACQPWKRTSIGAVHSIGMAFAMLIAGWMSDVIGRKPALIISSVGCFIGNLKTLATSYPVYIFLEFLEASISGGAYAAGNVLMIEIGNKENRMLAGVLFAYAIYMGEALFAIIAMFVPYWKSLINIICSPTILFLIYIIIVRESPRWLILNGKLAEAKYTLKEMIKMNNIKVNSEELDAMDEDELKRAYNIGTDKKKEGFKEVYKCKEILKRFLVAFECRFTVSFIYYGLIVNSVGLPGDKYINFLLGAIMSFPGELISMYMMNKFGRRLPLIYGYLFCGIACVAYGYVPQSYTGLKISFFLLGKLLASACYTGIVTYTMELFPTSVRGSLLGLCTLASCSGNMLGLLTPLLASISSVLAAICFGFTAITASALLILTPETRDLPLADTIEQIASSATNVKNKKQGEENLAYDSQK
ncbi:organic cation transporter protein-like [Vanessa cardui]|uniref:organic cation transporter protein-like n=1 Tax=Vanessa cardui TaxID=171605 RepID=UPI001F141895|nr:organic cation transporter protein-like [Vanessa cardui]